MIKRIIIVGKGGSGKDYLRKNLEMLGYNYCTSHTTRPPREGEVNGVDYFFISNSEAEGLISEDSFYEYVTFNNWIYGTSKSEFYSSQLFIMTPSGLKKLLPEDRLESFVVYLDIDEDIRRNRLMQRNDADNVERRLGADHRDFEGFKDYDLIITNPTFDTFLEIIEESKIGIENDKCVN